MHPRGHELVHIRSMNWVQSTFITCHAFLFFARTSLDILGHMTVSSTTLHYKRRAMDLGQLAAAMCQTMVTNGAQPLQLFKCSCLAIHGAHIPVNVFGQAHASEKFFLCFPVTFTVVALRFSPPRTLLIQHLAAWPDPILSH